MTERNQDDSEESDAAAVEVPSTSSSGLDAAWPVPHVPVVGTRKGLLAQFESALAVGAVELLSRMPFALQEGVVACLARIGRAVDRSHARSAREFVRQAMKTDDARTVEALVLAGYRQLMRVSLDNTAFERRVPDERALERIELSISDDVRRVVEEKQGCIVVTGHVGDWEMCCGVVRWIGLGPVYAIAKPPRNYPLSVRIQTVRERRGVRMLPRRGAMQHSQAVIRAKGCVYMLLDQRARKRPVMAEFFGRRACCDRSAGVLIKRLGVPIVFAACYRTEEHLRWRFEAERVVWPAEGKSKSVEELVDLVNRELERLILRAPDQYFWLHDRYRGGDRA